MAARRIFCKGCNKYLGEIRDATLRKDIVHLCFSCETKRLASDLARKTDGYPPQGMNDSEAMDFFNGIFSKK